MAEDRLEISFKQIAGVQDAIIGLSEEGIVFAYVKNPDGWRKMSMKRVYPDE